MGGTFGLGMRTTATASANANAEIIAAASGARSNILATELTEVTGVAGQYGVGRPAATGITPTSPQTVVDESDGNGAIGATTMALAWGTGPTVPANFNRRYTDPATIGAGCSIVFPNGFKLAASKSLVWWIIATAPVCDINVIVSE